MSLKERIHTDLTEALKARDEFKANALRYILAQIYNREIAKGRDAVLTDEELVEVLQKQAKERQESIEAYKAGGRSDLVEKETRELDLLKSYLPEQLTDEEVHKLVEETIIEVQASALSDMGRVMAALMPKVKGRADGSMVSQIVKDRLSP